MVLRVLDSRHQRKLSVVIIFVSYQIILIESFLHRCHITIELELIFDFHLLVQHVFIPLLLHFFVIRQIVFKLPGLLSLDFGLVLVEEAGVI